MERTTRKKEINVSETKGEMTDGEGTLGGKRRARREWTGGGEIDLTRRRDE